MEILKVKNISVSYKIGYQIVHALEHVSFTVTKGQYLCIIGENGSGKSSLIQSILKLIPTSQGNIEWSVSKDKISYLPQSTSIPSDFPATVFEIILSGTQKPHLGRIPFYTGKDYIRAKAVMESHQLTLLQNRRFGELSGGQKQRVLLARALCKKPDILILDEPCSGLDASISKSFYSTLNTMNQKHDTTIIMVSHDLSQIVKYATHILHLKNHQLAFCGTSKQWITQKQGGK